MVYIDKLYFESSSDNNCCVIGLLMEEKIEVKV